MRLQQIQVPVSTRNILNFMYRTLHQLYKVVMESGIPWLRLESLQLVLCNRSLCTENDDFDSPPDL